MGVFVLQPIYISPYLTWKPSVTVYAAFHRKSAMNTVTPMAPTNPMTGPTDILHCGHIQSTTAVTAQSRSRSIKTDLIPMRASAVSPSRQKQRPSTGWESCSSPSAACSISNSTGHYEKTSCSPNTRFNRECPSSIIPRFTNLNPITKTGCPGQPVCNHSTRILNIFPQIVFHGIRGGFGAVADAQLREDAADIVADGSLAQKERLGDLTVGLTF